MTKHAKNEPGTCCVAIPPFDTVFSCGLGLPVRRQNAPVLPSKRGKTSLHARQRTIDYGNLEAVDKTPYRRHRRLSHCRARTPNGSTWALAEQDSRTGAGYIRVQTDYAVPTAARGGARIQRSHKGASAREESLSKPAPVTRRHEARRIHLRAIDAAEVGSRREQFHAQVRTIATASSFRHHRYTLHLGLRRKWCACTPDLNRSVERSSSCRGLDRP